MSKPLTKLEIINLAARCLTATEFRTHYPYHYRAAQDKGWLKELAYVNSTSITLSNGWKIPWPPKNFIFTLVKQEIE